MSLYIELTTTDPNTGGPFLIVDGKHLPCYVLHARTNRSLWHATLDGAERMGRYIEEYYPEEIVSCSSSVDFPEDCGVSISRDDFDAAVSTGRVAYRRELMPRKAKRLVEVRLLVEVEMPDTVPEHVWRGVAEGAVQFEPVHFKSATLKGTTSSIIG